MGSKAEIWLATGNSWFVFTLFHKPPVCFCHNDRTIRSKGGDETPCLCCKSKFQVDGTKSYCIRESGASNCQGNFGESI